MKAAALVIAFCLVGVIDQIHGNDVLVEFETEESGLEHAHLPKWMFPCKIKEGDVFRIVKKEGVLSVKCGRSQEQKK